MYIYLKQVIYERAEINIDLGEGYVMYHLL